MNAIQIRVLKWQQLNNGFSFVQLIKLQKRWELGSLSTWLPDTLTLGLRWSWTSQKGAFGEASLPHGIWEQRVRGPRVPSRTLPQDLLPRVSTTPLRDRSRWAFGDFPYPIWTQWTWLYNVMNICNIADVFNMCECMYHVCVESRGGYHPNSLPQGRQGLLNLELGWQPLLPWEVS